MNVKLYHCNLAQHAMNDDDALLFENNNEDFRDKEILIMNN